MAAIAAIGDESRARKTSGENQQFNGATCSAAARAIIQNVQSGLSICGDGACADNCAGMNDDDPSSGRAAAVYTGGIGVCWIGGTIIGCAGTAAATHDDIADGTGKGRSTKTIAKRCGVPSVATVATATAVAPTATARVLRVTGRIGVGTATTRITRRSASIATVGQTFDGVVDHRT